jgi:hypothetical protein
VEVGRRRRIWRRDHWVMAFSELFTERLRLRRISEADLDAVTA